MNRSITSPLLFCALSFVAPQPASAINIDTVPVGNLGNAPDQNYFGQGQFGAAAYAYRIGTTEVTVGQYTAFLNAVAATDTYALYSTPMAENLNVAGIARSGVSGSFTYSVIGSANHPVTYVSWGDAARFANWLHKGQPGIGVVGGVPQDMNSTERGAYTLDGAVTDAALNAVSRNASASWFIPSENEWYKAAYFQPAAQGGDADNYWLYPMRTNSVPYSDQPPGATPDNTRVGNFNETDGLVNGYNDGYAVTGTTRNSSSQNYLTDVGAYSSSASFYGTFDQGGNVYEWNEALISGSFRSSRGGSWFYDSDSLRASFRVGISPSDAIYNIGFRVATIPEPNTAALAAFGFLAFAAHAWRKRRYCVAAPFHSRRSP